MTQFTPTHLPKTHIPNPPMFHKIISFPFASTLPTPKPTSQFNQFFTKSIPTRLQVQSHFQNPYPNTTKFSQNNSIAPKNSHLPRPYLLLLLLLLHRIETQVWRRHGRRRRGRRRSRRRRCRPPTRPHPAGPSSTSSNRLHAN